MFDFKRSMKVLAEGKRQLQMVEDVQRPQVDGSVIDLYRKKIRVFVFETLMNPEIRAAVLKSDIETQVASLQNWKEVNMETNEGKDYHSIVPSLGDITKGMILFVDQDQLEKLDYWEDQYDRVKCVLSDGNYSFVYVLKTDNMKDFGQNTTVDLNADDIAQIKWAADNM